MKNNINNSNDINVLKDGKPEHFNQGRKRKLDREKRVHMDRVSTVDMIDSMRILKPIETVIAPIIISYNSVGNDDIKGKKFTDAKACACTITVGRQVIYKIKIGRDGNPYNPNKEGFSYSLTAEDRLSNDLMFRFKEVNSKAFENYIQFLKTKYDSFLNIVAREL